MDDVQRNTQLRNRDVTINKGRINPNHPSRSQQNTDKKKEKQKEQIVYKDTVNKVEKTNEVKQPALIDVGKQIQISTYK